MINNKYKKICLKLNLYKLCNTTVISHLVLLLGRAGEPANVLAASASGIFFRAAPAPRSQKKPSSALA